MKRREKEKYKQKFYQSNKNKESLQKEKETLEKAKEALEKTNEEYK